MDSGMGVSPTGGVQRDVLFVEDQQFPREHAYFKALEFQ